MPSILKSLLRSTLHSRPSRKDRHAQTLSPGAFSNDGDRSSAYSTDELAQLTADLAHRLSVHESGPSSSGQNIKPKSKSRSKPRTKSRGAFQDKLHSAVEAIEAQGQGQVDPYYPSYNPFPSLLTPPTSQNPPSQASQAYQPSSPPPINNQHYANQYHSPSPQASHQAQPTHSSPAPAAPAFIPPAQAAPHPSAGDEWTLAFQSCSAALTSAEYLARQPSLPPRTRQLVDKCVSLLDAQRDELLAMRPWAEDKQLPMFRTLTQVYTEILHAFDQVAQDPSSGSGGLRTVVQVLQEGPDYLIDIGLVECIIWQAEVVDPNYGAGIRNLLDEAVAAQVGLSEFRQRLAVIMEVALAPPAGAVDDDLGRDALDAIQRLVKQLKRRTGAHLTAQSAPPPMPALNAQLLQSPASSTASSPAPSPGLTQTHTAHNAQTLQEAYGTGPLPTPSPSPYPSPYPSRAPSPTPSSTSTSSSQKSIFEYRGHRLTRSALELVQTQERLAMADSSGQYAGEVSWDDLRNAWIPNWAEKLRPGDLAEGELADNNPANYREKKRDAWGNRIGWYEGRMYYEEEPVFDLRS